MKTTRTILLIIILAFSSFYSIAAAEQLGTVEVGLGPVIPEGKFNHYSKTGPSAYAKFVLTPFQSKTVGFLFGLTGSGFDHKTEHINIESIGDAKLETANLSLNGTLGIRLQVDRDILRPYCELTTGFYWFTIESWLKDSNDETVDHRTMESQVLGGYSITGGLAIWLNRGWALDLNLKYDNTFGLEQYIGAGKFSKFNSHFTSIYVGFQILIGSEPEEEQSEFIGGCFSK